MSFFAGTRRRSTRLQPMSGYDALTILRFCDAVRAKEKWFFKILDERNLAATWAQEAGLVYDQNSVSEEDVVFRDTIQELKDEARRICVYDHTIRLDHGEVPSPIPVDFKVIDADTLNALKYIQGARYAIDKPELRQDIGAFVSDDIVPVSLHRELLAELDALAAVEPKDFHPGTLGKVQDLIHPSLYPFIAGITHTDKPASMIDGEFVTSMEANEDSVQFKSIFSWIPSVFQVSEDGLDVYIESYINGLGPREQYPVLYRLIEKVFLLVLPQLERTLQNEFKVNDSKSVGRWFDRAPARDWSNKTTRTKWEALLAAQASRKAEEEAEKLQQQMEKGAFIENEKNNMAQFYEMDDSKAGVSHRGAKLKVIVKAANYVLKPGQDYRGTWHIEGMPHERIVASAIYYYDTDPEIEDEGLSFRYLRDLSFDFPAPNSPRYMHQDDFQMSLFGEETEFEDDVDYPSDWEEELDGDGNTNAVPIPMSLNNLHKYIPLGAVPTTNFSSRMKQSMNPKGQSNRGTGRIITFPNWVQHQVTLVRNQASSTEPNAPISKRKILCFFVVDDDDLECDEKTYHGFAYRGLRNLSVLTTADVPFQKRCSDPTLYFLLVKACWELTGKNLPAELVSYIIDNAYLGLSRERAEHHRRCLMGERKVQPKDPAERDVFNSTYSLCEH